MRESEKWKWSCSIISDSTPWTAAHEASPSAGFSRQGYWSGVPLPSPKEGARETNPLNLYMKLRLIPKWFTHKTKHIQKSKTLREELRYGIPLRIQTDFSVTNRWGWPKEHRKGFVISTAVWTILHERGILKWTTPAHTKDLNSNQRHRQ